MKRTAQPSLSPVGQEALASYERWLREREDLAAASIRNYLSDLRHFIAWYEAEREAHVHDSFTPQGITTSALTRYQTYLQSARFAASLWLSHGGVRSVTPIGTNHGA